MITRWIGKHWRGHFIAAGEATSPFARRYHRAMQWLWGLGL